jgi:cyclopropane fatty-acyl-phospholipid synthase-like methyltransferase
MKLQLLTLLSISGGCLLPAILAAAVLPRQDPQPAPDHHPSSGSQHVDVHRPGMKHDFSDVAKHEKSFDGAERAAWQKPDHVIALMAIQPGMTVVDLGAGTGFFEPPLARAVGATGKVLALDVEPNMVEHLRARAAEEKLTQVDARLAAPDDPGLAPGSVDRIVIVNTWHHIDDRGNYSAKLRSALRPAGAIYVVDFDKGSAKGPPANHKLEPSQVIAELEAGGLEARQIDEELSEQYVVVARPRPQP